MFIQLGIACFMIWLLNWSWIFYTIFKHTKDEWKDADVDGDEIVMKFLAKADMELLQKFQMVTTINPNFFWIGAALLTLGLII